MQDADIVLIGFGKEFNIHKNEILKESKYYNSLNLEESPLDELEKQWIEYTLVYRELKSGENTVVNNQLAIYDKVADYLVNLKKNKNILI